MIDEETNRNPNNYCFRRGAPKTNKDFSLFQFFAESFSVDVIKPFLDSFEAEIRASLHSLSFHRSDGAVLCPFPSVSFLHHTINQNVYLERTKQQKCLRAQLGQRPVGSDRDCGGNWSIPGEFDCQSFCEQYVLDDPSLRHCNIAILMHFYFVVRNLGYLNIIVYRLGFVARLWVGKLCRLLEFCRRRVEVLLSRKDYPETGGALEAT